MTMTLLLVLSAWMLVLWLATGLCAAARLGDRTQVEDRAGALPQGQRLREAWESTGPVSKRAEVAVAHGEAGALRVGSSNSIAA